MNKIDEALVLLELTFFKSYLAKNKRVNRSIIMPCRWAGGYFGMIKDLFEVTFKDGGKHLLGRAYFLLLKELGDLKENHKGQHVWDTVSEENWIRSQR